MRLAPLPLALLTGLALGAPPAKTDPAADYLRACRLRKTGAPIGLEKFDAFQGVGYFDVRAVSSGESVVGDDRTLLLSSAQGTAVFVPLPKTLPWAEAGNEVRLLVKAERTEETDALRLTFLAGAPQSAVGPLEAKLAARAARGGSVASRSNVGRAAVRAAAPKREWNMPVNEVVPIYADFVRKRNPRLSADDATQIAHGLVGYSLRYGVDARLVVALILAESNFDPGATSRTGAMGLGQLMPGTARWMGVSNAYDLRENLYGCIRLLSKHLRDYRAQVGDEDRALTLALAAYNAGEGAVRRHGGVPPYRETQAYVRKVTAMYRRLCGE